jgi:hypothetical protein
VDLFRSVRREVSNVPQCGLEPCLQRIHTKTLIEQPGVALGNLPGYDETERSLENFKLHAFGFHLVQFQGADDFAGLDNISFLCAAEPDSGRANLSVIIGDCTGGNPVIDLLCPLLVDSGKASREAEDRGGQL